jgi:hypothetical protein
MLKVFGCGHVQVVALVQHSLVQLPPEQALQLLLLQSVAAVQTWPGESGSTQAPPLLQ